MNSYEESLIKLNLQLFANDEGGEKTEEPTAKKIDDSRKEGQVAKSKEISTAASLLAVFLCLKVFIGFLGERLTGVFQNFWSELDVYSTSAFNSITAMKLLAEGLKYILITCVPFFIISFVVAFLSQAVQFKWMVTSKPLQPKLNKLNPIS